MFDEDGAWKEFSLTLDEKHTWFPFWLFCILWAILCYSIISYLFEKNETSSSNSMKPGYYVLDKQATKKEGFPKYIYLGSDNPEE
jgi:hypothetical protein